VQQGPLLAPKGLIGPIWRCPFTGADRKWLAQGKTEAIDPKQTSPQINFYVRDQRTEN
jgi:hypothetical protein